MAQASLRRPAIEVRPAHARILQVLLLTLHDHEARLAIGFQRTRVIEGVGVEPERRDTAGEGALYGPVEQPRADAVADVGEREAEEDQLVARQLEIADQLVVMACDDI